MNKYPYLYSILLMLMLAPIAIFGQNLEISGKVVDGESKEALPFASVALVSKATGAVLSGAVSDEEGNFLLKSDSTNVRVECSFMGFDKFVMETLPQASGKIELGTIALKMGGQTTEEVTVEVERSRVEFKLDKRVFHVGKDISSTGAGDLEVLNNVPSVSVDMEGNVSLRGNRGVQILIDGKPSAMSDDPRKALGAISADMIESIEVITNPSAKYEAGGTSGIINIILKKEEKTGINGSISVNTGLPHNHSIGGSLNYRRQKFNFFTQFGGGYRSTPTNKENTNLNRLSGSSVESVGKEFRDEQFYNITIGADYFINKYNTLTLSGNVALEIENNPSSYLITLRDSNEQIASQYSRSENTTALNPKWQYDLQYKKQFKSHKEHVLLMSAQGKFFGKDQRSLFTNAFAVGDAGAFDQSTKTNFYQADYNYKLDYTNPLGKGFLLEMGGAYNINDVGNDYAVFDLIDAQWQANEGLTNDFLYTQKVLGGYATGSYENKKWGIKLGLRVENTDLTTVLATTEERNHNNFTDFFPSLHTSLKVTDYFSMQAGYSRRIMRPRLWDLNPFFNIQNNFNIRTGNPRLLPEYADSYELTAIYILEKWSLNGSLYHLYTRDVMENVSYFQNGVNLSTRENIGTNRKTGIEFNGKYTPVDWFSVAGDFNFGFFSRKGEFDSAIFDFSSSQWSSKLMLKCKLPKGIDIELTPSYQSRIQTVQGYTRGFLVADFGLRKKLLKNKAVLSLGIRDMFATRITETIAEREAFYLRSYSLRGRFVVLGFSYSFGKGEVMSYNGGGRH